MPALTKRILITLGALVVSLGLGVAAAWPIYRTPWLWLVAAVALIGGASIALARARWKWTFPITVAVTLVFFILTIVPVAVPQTLERLPQGLVRGLLDGLAAIALGWKQLLTLSLPVGTYQTVLVPAFVVFFATALLGMLIALRRSALSALAAIPMLLPVAFGTVFGASVVSDPLRLGPLTITAPRELGLWLAAALLGAVWVVRTAGAERRAALKRGGADMSRGRAARIVTGSGIVVVALISGLALAPVVTADDRDVPRDRIDPEIVIRDQPSPLASYRASKRDAAFDEPLISVTSDGALPHALRFAVLDAYDGTDFRVSEEAAGRFTRFPSGDAPAEPSNVTVEIAAGHEEIWTPTAFLGNPPRFHGERAADLSDAFYVNRETSAAITVPEGEGLVAGDAYTAEMEAVDPPAVPERPAAEAPLFDLEQTPEIAEWLSTQDVGNAGSDLVELIDRLRDRGYLSHSISDDEVAWLAPLQEEFGTRFESSAGGHSLARVEMLFSQLNAQQRAAGDDAPETALVAGIGDDEQFATAAALIARALGFESRVVVGVRLADAGANSSEAGVPGIPACTGTCTGQHLAAWIEVRGDSGPWAPIDVTPQAEIRPQTLEEGEQLPEFPTVPEEHEAQEVDPPLGLGDQNDSAEDPGDDQAAGWWWPVLRIVGLSLAALIFAALPFLFLPLAKRRRARVRRGESNPELRGLGAWNEMVDRAADARVPVPEGATRTQIGAALGTKPAIWAAREVDRAVFSPGGISEPDADMLWEAALADRAERRSSMTRWQRLREVYSVRSYGVRRRSGGAKQNRHSGLAGGTDTVSGEDELGRG